MSVRLLWGTLPRLGRSPHVASGRVYRGFSSPAAPPRRSALPAICVVTGVSAISYWWLKDELFVYADAAAKVEKAKHEKSLSSLVRAYVVYGMCSIPPLVDWSPTILSTLLAVPGISSITTAVVRVTFFNQFVGAETAEEAVPLVEELRAENKGCLFAYSVEVDEHSAAGQAAVQGKNVQPAHKQGVQEMLHSIDVAADFEDKYLPAGTTKGRRTWVAIKLTALVPDHLALINLSNYIVKHRPSSSDPVAFPGTPQPSDLAVLYSQSSSADGILTAQNIHELKELYEDMDAICKRAHERGVKIIIDAEYSWYQPAVDAIALVLMSKYNRLTSSSDASSVQPLIYNTYQAYLRRTESHLIQSFQIAKANNFALGVKLVRGAYHPHELAAHTALSSPTTHSLSISPDALPPVWATKPETDACYNTCVGILLDAVAADVVPPKPTRSWFGASEPAVPRPPAVGVLFGTHNWGSCRLILDQLVARGLAEPAGETDAGERVVRLGSEVTERVSMAQLYGMHDDLTDYLVDRTRSSAPFVIKYVPYGSLAEVMPYLSRRAIENKSVLGDGAAANERARAWKEIKKKLFG